MKASVIMLPGSNCDRDIAEALAGCGFSTHMVWHAERELPASDLVVIPGGFSYGDYLRSGAIAAHAPILEEVRKFADNGGYVLGVCNGFQVLTEMQLLPGTLMRNRDLRFICKDVYLKVENVETAFTRLYQDKRIIRVPVAHHDGNYFADTDTLKSLEDNGQVVFRYCAATGAVNDNSNPNGSLHNIAGIVNARRNVLGLMPHPERLWEDALGGKDGRALFDSLLGNG